VFYSQQDQQKDRLKLSFEQKWSEGLWFGNPERREIWFANDFL